jgi:hypothetical protein
MKIGIITYHFSENYGALFQAYALRQWFISQGHQAEFINYQPDYVEGGGAFNLSRPISKDNLKILFLKLISFKEHFFGNMGLKQGFDAFRSDKLGVSGRKFKRLEELENVLSIYDLIVCGSDQIWKPSEHHGVDPVYYLDFPFKTPLPRRISYAPSFGTDQLNIEFHDVVSEAIRKLDGISVREKTGCNIVEGLTGMRPVCVPDPTLLLTDYKTIMKSYPIKSSKHVFCYALRSREAIGEVAEVLAENLGAELYSPHNPHRRWREIGKTVYPCPSQWLYLLNSAEYVVTNSFHGTALSILLRKPFVVVGLQGSKSEFNARVNNLLSMVGLESRFVQNVDKTNVNRLMNEIIDWDVVDRKVKALRESGVNYLQAELAQV